MYSWSVANGTLVSVNPMSPQTATIRAGASGVTTVTANVTMCDGTAASVSKDITIDPLNVFALIAPSTVVADSTRNVVSVRNVSGFGSGSSYSWSIEGGTITSNPNYSSVVFTAGSSGSVTLSVNAIFCGSLTTRSVTIPIITGGLPSSSVGDASVTEGNSGTVPSSFTVTLSEPSALTVAVDYAIVDDSATYGSDYTGVSSGTLTFLPGETTKAIPFSAIGDLLAEANETFSVALSNANNASILDGEATGTIIDDDPATPPSILASGPTAFCAGGSVTLTSSEVGSSYSWRRDGIEVATTPSFTATTQASYTLLLTRSNGLSILTEPLYVEVFSPPPATITQTVTPAGEVVLLANPIGMTYLWSDGSTDRSLAATVSGTYSVRVTDANGCSASAAATVQIAASGQTSFTDPVTGVSLDFNKLTAGSTVTVTSPASATVTNPAGYYEFVGLDGTTRTYDISVSGSYSAPITLTFPVPWRANDLKGFKAIKIMHGEMVNGALQFVDVTQKHNYDRQNPELSTIVAQVNSLSPFAFAAVRRPTLEPITAPVEPVEKGATVSAMADFTDPDGSSDVHTAIWNWGDGTTTPGAVIEPGADDGFGSVIGSHVYAAPGVYTISVQVSDNTAAGGVDSATFRYLVVYDPDGGFVTGGGWIASPPGAYVANASLAGKATFGFVSKYATGAQVPTGRTEFNFQAASFQFKSTTYEWLVVSGAKAQYKGVGAVNGSGDYGFLLTATDGQLNGGGGIDKLRVKIWERATGTIVYDNVAGASDDPESSNPQEIGGGSIVIHRSR